MLIGRASFLVRRDFLAAVVTATGGVKVYDVTTVDLSTLVSAAATATMGEKWNTSSATKEVERTTKKFSVSFRLAFI